MPLNDVIKYLRKSQHVGSETAIQVKAKHYVSGNRIVEPFPPRCKFATFAMGCFWGPEKKFWQMAGVYSTMVGYSGGQTKYPRYEQVCGGQTGHAEVVRIVYDGDEIGYQDLLRVFWEGHDPTQYMRQGNDVGSQYRSAIHTHDEAQRRQALSTRELYQQQLSAQGHGSIVTEILPAQTFFYAEDYHQQYLAKNMQGYCGAGGLGVRCPVP